MENAVQAIKIGAAILVFSIAVATTFLIFAQAKQTADTVFTIYDNDNYTEFVEGDSNSLNRVVGIDTVISTLYEYYQELYSVTIISKDGTVVGNFDIAKETLDRQRMMARLDTFVEEKLLKTNLKNSKFEESFYEYVYKGGTYTDPVTLETIQDINTQTKIDITFKEI